MCKHRYLKLSHLQQYFCYSCQHSQAPTTITHLSVFKIQKREGSLFNIFMRFYTLFVRWLLPSPLKKRWFELKENCNFQVWSIIVLILANYLIIINLTIKNFIFINFLFCTLMKFFLIYYYDSFRGEPANSRFVGISLLTIIDPMSCNPNRYGLNIPS